MQICYSLPELEKATIALGMLKLGYIRVSTEMNHQDSSVKRQIQDFEDEGCNIAIVERESGTSIERRILYQKIIELIQNKKILKIIVCESSRLNRNEKETTYFERLCKINSIPLIYLNEPELNTGDYRAELLRRDKAIEAETYSRVLGRNLRKGNDRLRKNLKPVSRKAPFGYRFASDRGYEIDRAKSDRSNILGRYKDTGKLYASGELARLIIEDYLKFESQSKAFKRFKLFLDELEIVNEKLWLKAKNRSQTWISGWLQDPTIRGHIAYGKYKETYRGEKLEEIVRVKAPRSEWKIKYNCHEALIIPQEWQQIKIIIEQNHNLGWARQNGNRNLALPAPLSRLLRCNCCKLTFNTQSTNQKGKKYRYYRCVGRRESRCKQGGISERKLVKSMVEIIISKAEELTNILYDAQNKSSDPRNNEIEKLQREADDLINLYNSSGRQNYLQTHKEITEEIQQIRQSINSEVSDARDKQEVLEALQDESFWDSMTRKELHDYLKAIVRTAFIEDKEVVSVELLL